MGEFVMTYGRTKVFTGKCSTMVCVKMIVEVASDEKGDLDKQIS